MGKDQKAAAVDPSSASSRTIEYRGLRPFTFPRAARFKSPYGLPPERLSRRLAKVWEEKMKEALAPYGGYLTPEKAKELSDGAQRVTCHEDRIDPLILAELRARSRSTSSDYTHLPPKKKAVYTPVQWNWGKSLTPPGTVITPNMFAEHIAELKKMKPCFVLEASEVENAAQFYKAAFGFEEVKRESCLGSPFVTTVELKIGEFVFVVSDRMGDGQCPNGPGAAPNCMEVDDVEAVINKSVNAGATFIVRASVCTGEVRDIYGKGWLLYSKCTDPKCLHEEV